MFHTAGKSLRVTTVLSSNFPGLGPQLGLPTPGCVPLWWAGGGVCFYDLLHTLWYSLRFINQHITQFLKAQSTSVEGINPCSVSIPEPHWVSHTCPDSLIHELHSNSDPPWSPTTIHNQYLSLVVPQPISLPSSSVTPVPSPRLLYLFPRVVDSISGVHEHFSHYRV